ncbi:MAG: FHA domain-containing protein [Desulfobacteraceae bacterium]|jgi:pSer/pThr/pTyr-binding forkhead associated (FHA) protein|nr:MAG: FHA domain-containing protein [Desulfobacteraceae bacterium]
MAEKPNIIVTIVHIEGPLKGEIQEFSENEIRIGRNVGSHVQFPGEILIVSRDHARIIREGNRFKLFNNSENMTYLNGKPVEPGAEAYLKSGDWLMFAQGGPKVSFLTKIDESRPAPAPARPVYEEKKIAEPRITKDRAKEENPSAPIHKPPARPPQPSQTPLLIRYGPMLKRFSSLPVTIGNSDQCDLNIKHDGINDEHIQIYFSQGEYLVKDLTGRGAVLINGRPIDGSTALRPDDHLQLSSQGPTFRFLDGGRLDEVN